MLIGSPIGELREIVKDILAVAVKNMRTIAMYEDPGVIVMIEGIARDVWSLVHDKHPGVILGSQTLGENAPCETRANNEVVEHD